MMLDGSLFSLFECLCAGTERVLFDEFGMPSSHAQFMWFFGIYLSLFVIFRYCTHKPYKLLVESHAASPAL